MVDIAKLSIEVDSKGARQATEQLDRLGLTATQTEQKTRRATDGLTASFKRMAGGIAVAAAAYKGLTSAFNATEGYTRATNQLRALGLSANEAATQYRRLAEISRDTRTPLEALNTLYSRLSLSADSLGASQAEIEKLTRNVGLALAQTGGSVQEASGALLQLSQAFAGGIVRAEEFNSIIEGATPIAIAAARAIDGMEGNVGKLRQAVNDGEITSRQFFDALLSQTQELEAQFSSTLPTISQGFAAVTQELGLFVGEMVAATGAAKGLGLALFNMAGFLSRVREGFVDPSPTQQVRSLSDAFKDLSQTLNAGTYNTIENALELVTGNNRSRTSAAGSGYTAEEIEKITEAAEDLRRQLDEAYDATQTYNEGVETLEKALAIGAITQDIYADGVRRLREELESLNEVEDKVAATGDRVLQVIKKTRPEVDRMGRAADSAAAGIDKLAASFNNAAISAAAFGQMAASSIGNVFTALASGGDVSGSLQALAGQVPSTLISSGLSQAFDPSSGVGLGSLLSGGGGNLSGVGASIDSFLFSAGGQYGPAAPGGFFSRAGAGFNFASSLAGMGGQLLGSAIFGGGTGTSIGGTLGSTAGTAIGASISALGAAGGPIGAVAGSLLGSALGSLFNKKPSNKEGNAILDLATGEISVGGQTGKKFSQENRDTANSIAAALAPISAILEASAGAALDGSVRVGIGNRDGLYAEFGEGATNPEFGFGNETRQFFDASEAGIGELVNFVSNEFADQLGDKLPEAVRIALENIDFSSEQGIADLQFAAAFTDLFGLNVETIGPVELAMSGLVNQLNTFTDAADRLGLSVAEVERQFNEATDKFRADIIAGLESDILAVIDPTAAALRVLREEFAAIRTDLQSQNIDTTLLDRLQALREEQLLLPDLNAQLQASVDARRADIESRISLIEEERSALVTQMAIASSVTDFLTDGLRIADRLRSTYRTILGDNEQIAELQRISAQSELRGMLASGSVDERRLDLILPALTRNATNQFASAIDFRRDQAITAGLLATLADQQEQIAIEAQAEEDARAKRESAILQQQIDALDAQIGLEQASLMALDGILQRFGLLNDNVISVEQAIRNLEQVGGPAGFNLGVNAATNRQLLADLPWLAAMLEPYGGFGTGILPSLYANQFTDAQRAEYDAARARVPGFAGGGYHGGGLRIVGERGPEIEATGPSRIYNNAQMRDMMRVDMTEIRKMREELGALMRQVSKNTGKTSKQLDRWDQDGLPEERDVS